MKMALLVAGSMFLAGAANADVLSITSITDVTTPASQITSNSANNFVGTDQIVVKLGNKTCTWVGSASARGPKGCNYGITINNSTLELSNPSADNSNPGCTSASEMIADCN